MADRECPGQVQSSSKNLSRIAVLTEHANDVEFTTSSHDGTSSYSATSKASNTPLSKQDVSHVRRHPRGKPQGTPTWLYHTHSPNRDTRNAGEQPSAHIAMSLPTKAQTLPSTTTLPPHFFPERSWSPSSTPVQKLPIDEPLSRPQQPRADGARVYKWPRTVPDRDVQTRRVQEPGRHAH